MKQDTYAKAVIAGVALVTVATLATAVELDRRNGVTVSQSLGIDERPAVPVRLIGACNGQILGAMEESAFPAGCDWIETINIE
jgi:hypothetical protein